MHLPGYTLVGELHRGRKRVVYRASRESDGATVIIKSLANEFPTAADTANLRREFAILQSLEIPGVARALALESHRGRPVLVLADAGDRTLKDLIVQREIDLPCALVLAEQVAATLAALHGAGIVHKDVNPHNIIIDRSTSTATLGDFGIASRAASEPQRPGVPHLIEGTLAYMSPEQTGRMNRHLDYRTDLYSLGVTLYEMLTGRVPFESLDPLEVIHGHVARAPQPPRELVPGLPRVVADLVVRLLHKAAEDRYQSAEGVAADLARCRKALQAGGTFPDFTLGASDARYRFVIPQHLYGREAEIELLMAAFERAVAGRAELVLVSGYSGIGKTSLVQEVHRGLAGSRGHFVAGKFDQLVRDAPYGALAQALQQLLRHVLAEADQEVADWRAALGEALGGSGQALIPILPELAHLIGPQAPLPALEPAEAQNRLSRAFQQLLAVVASAEHPLVIFLDDLQWADAATLRLLPQLLADPGLSGLLVIGAYRDNEVPPSHPLRGVIRSVQAGGTRLTELTLGPLGTNEVLALVRDTLGGADQLAAPLADIVHGKTVGNPFFVNQFLQSLHRDQHLAFDHATRSWQADLPAIRELRMTDNVVDLLAVRMQRLPQATQRVLRLGACVGGRFDLATLATIAEEDAERTMGNLWAAVEEGLLLPGEQSYGFAPDLTDGRSAGQRWFRFLHDRVQQAAYALIPDGDRRQVHLTIGRLMLARGADPSHPAWLFDVVNQLNYGSDLVRDPPERLECARLNLAAGRRAKASAAFRGSLTYFLAGSALLPADAWREQRELAWELALEAAEASYLSGAFEEGERRFRALLEQAESALEYADVAAPLVVQFETMERFGDAIAVARDALLRLGVVLPVTVEAKQAALQGELTAIDARIAGREIAALVDLPPIADAAVHRAMKLLTAAWASAYILADVPLSTFIAARIVHLSLEHGHAPESAFGYVLHGVTLGSGLGRFEQGWEFGALAIQVNERLADLRLRAKVHHMFSAFVNLWRKPFASCLPHAREAHRAGLESGDLQFAGYGLFHQSWYALVLEPELEALEREFAPTVVALQRIKMEAWGQVQRLILNWALALRGGTQAPTSLSSAEFSEADFQEAFRGTGIFESFWATAKLALLYTFGDAAEAVAFGERWQQTADGFVGSVWPAWFATYRALALAARLPDAGAAERPGLEVALDGVMGRLKVWAENSPENFGPDWLLVRAEAAAARGDAGSAIQGYEQALQAVAEESSPRHRALVNELYGRFWDRRERPRLAGALLAEARFEYDQWGAAAKVADLDRRYGSILAGSGSRESAGPRVQQTTQVLASSFDFRTVMKAAEALVSEIDLERLLGRLLQVALEHAGAERGWFLLEHDGAPAIHASGAAGAIAVHLEEPQPLTEESGLPHSVINIVRRTGESVVLPDAAVDGPYTADPYVARERPRSVIALPVHNQGRLIGTLYLENNLASGVFTADRIQVLQILCAQAAIALENARLFTEIRRLKDRLQAENVYLIEEIKTQHGFEEIVGRSPALQRVLSKIEQVAQTDTTVLITGETGTGKELVARALHNLSPRRDRPLVTVNCGAISPSLVESELFGHEKGAFTGALARKVGRFELADGGTLFLDEIGDLPADLQVKLLRVLQDSEFERVGGSRPIKVNVRVITATHRDLPQLMQQGRFRADLFYRLNVFPIRTPALRDRKEDIPLLVRYLVLKYAQKMGKRIDTIPTEAMDALSAYNWPGNVRELGNVIERSVIVTRGTVLELGEWIPAVAATGIEADRAGNGGQAQRLEEVERAHILATLERAGWKVSGAKGAAQALGLKPTTLEWRMKKLGIQRPSRSGGTRSDR
jgi:predicted ATPase/transcriptional regulator with GAF, ATPase, and Fis domain